MNGDAIQSFSVPAGGLEGIGMEIEQEISVSQAVGLITTYAGRCSRSTLYRWLGHLKIEPVGGYISRDDLTLLILWAKAIYRIRDVPKTAKTVAAMRKSRTLSELETFAFNPQTSFTRTLIKEIGNAA